MLSLSEFQINFQRQLLGTPRIAPKFPFAFPLGSAYPVWKDSVRVYMPYV